MAERDDPQSIEDQVRFGRRYRACRAWALLGAFLIGVTLPATIVFYNVGERAVGGRVIRSLPSEEPVLTVPQLFEKWLELEWLASLMCGPGALVLGYMLFNLCAQNAAQPIARPRDGVLLGMVMGVIASGVNFPNVGLAMEMRGQDYSALRIVLYFVIFGASSGAWTAWQAWRCSRVEESLLPRFSLGTLMLFVFGCAGMLAVFAPK